MTSVEVGILGIILLFVLLFMKLPVSVAMILVGLVGNMLLSSPGPTLAKFGSDLILLTQNYNLSVIPLFVLMGLLLANTGLVSDLYDILNSFIGRFKAGMAMASIGAGAAFGAVCGSAVACASTIASVAVPEMSKHGYNRGFAASTAAVGSTLGIIIPPSTTLVLFGILTEESIGAMLIGGILPGLMTMVLLMITAYIMVLRNPELAPLKVIDTKTFSWKMLRNVWAVPLIFLLSFGGIWLGFFTPTEAGAVGAFLSFLFSLLTGKLTWKNFLESLDATVRITAMVFLMVIGGNMFGAFLTRTLIPLKLTAFIEGLNAPPFAIVLVILLIYTLMGPFMDELATMVIMTPVLYPIVIALGYDGVWFGVLTAMMLLTGLLVPPVGVTSLVVASVTKIPSAEVFKYQVPYWITLIIACIILIFIPDIILFLPRMMY